MSDPSSLALVPTRQAYGELQQAYDHFNRALFDGALPGCMITLQREKATCGYFSSRRFARADGQITDEIALNPAYFAVVPLVETLQTLVHEMVHLWQEHHGKPGRGRYHNEEWADKMERIGLMPTSTGKPGGKRTGDKISDYAIEGAAFLAACAELMTERFTISWFDRFPATEHVAFGDESMGQALPATVGGGQAPVRQNAALASAVVPPPSSSLSVPGQEPILAARPTRQKYSCVQCRANVWGKPGLNILCGTCNAPFVEV
jgi:predicted SprT family Zn-dependent metalloprotease